LRTAGVKAAAIAKRGPAKMRAGDHHSALVKTHLRNLAGRYASNRVRMPADRKKR